MSTQKLQLAGLLAAAAIAAPFAAHADNTVTFNGDLVDVTCTIVGSANGDQTVPLGTLAVSAFTSTNTIAAGTFKIAVTGCGTSAASMTPYFANLGSAVSINPATGHMKNIASSSPAAGVELELMNATTTTNSVLLNAGATAQMVDAATITGGGATSQFNVRYVKTGTVTAGTFTTGLTYSLTYN